MPTYDQLRSQANSLLADNTTGDISPSDVRTVAVAAIDKLEEVDTSGDSGGASEFADLSDAATVDMAAVNAPLAADLGKITPTQIAFTTSLPLTRENTLMGKLLTADLVFTEDSTGQIAGAGGTIRIKQGSTPFTVTFPSGWVERPGSQGISTTADMVHEVLYFFNGTDKSYTVVQLGVLATLTTPDTPTSGVVDDTADTFDWTNSSGFSAVSDYEYTLDGGSSYTTCSGKPISVGDVAKAIGQVGVRVAAVTGVNNASGTLYNASAFTTSGLTTPATPTSPITDDSANTFNWTNTSGYSALSDYEYTLNGGSSYAVVTAKPIAVGNVAKAAGQVGVRVKAVSGVSNASATLFNTVAFLIQPSAPTSGVVDDTANTFDWTYASGFTTATDYEYRIGGTGSFTAVSAKPLSVGNVAIAIGDLEVRVKAVTGNNLASTSLTNASAFTVTGGGSLADITFVTDGITPSGGVYTVNDGVFVVSHKADQTFTGDGYIQFDVASRDCILGFKAAVAGGDFTTFDVGAWINASAGNLNAMDGGVAKTSPSPLGVAPAGGSTQIRITRSGSTFTVQAYNGSTPAGSAYTLTGFTSSATLQVYATFSAGHLDNPKIFQ